MIPRRTTDHTRLEQPWFAPPFRCADTHVQIPRTINALNVLRAHWPEEVVAQLSTEPTRFVICTVL